MRRVLVTGLGAVTPFGIGVINLWSGLTSGRSAIRRITLFDPSEHAVQIAGEVPDFRPADHLDGKLAKRTERFAQFGLVAAREALGDARLDPAELNRERTAVMIYTGAGGIATIERSTLTRLSRGARAVEPLTIPRWMPNGASALVSMQLGITGPSLSGTAACAAGVTAFIDAVRQIELGYVDVAIAGASEALITPVMMTGFAATGALSTRNDDPAAACRPFSLDRDGTVLAEGAVVMILEAEEHAVRRNATAVAKAAGGATTSDAYHITAPDPSGRHMARAMQLALERAAVSPGTVDYVSAHGTGSGLGDIAETRAVHLALGEHARDVLVGSTKSMVGHLVGAAGAVSALACVLAIRDGIVPPTINLESPDPACDLDYAPNVAHRRPVRTAMVNGIAFGGQNASFVFTAPDRHS